MKDVLYEVRLYEDVGRLYGYMKMYYMKCSVG